MPNFKDMTSILKKNIGSKNIKILIVVVIIVVVAGSLGGFIVKTTILTSNVSVSSVLDGNWNQTQVHRVNAAQNNIGLSRAEWFEISYYYSGNKNLSVGVLKLIKSIYVSSDIVLVGSFLFGGMLSDALNKSGGNLNNAPIWFSSVLSG
jgi:hypothetical protein